MGYKFFTFIINYLGFYYYYYYNYLAFYKIDNVIMCVVNLFINKST